MRTPSPTDAPRERSPIHAIATVGNAVFLAFLAMILSLDRLFVPAPPAPATAVPATPLRAERCLLVVIDGLRADAASDASLMPTLAALSEHGCSGAVRIESFIPSTIAGVVSFTTGLPAAAAATLQDLRALHASRGGLFELLQNAGARSFVAGPPVWEDLYGQWIDQSVVPEALVASDDAPLVDATIAALQSDRFRLMIAHLGGPDDAAHVHGSRSAAYRAAVRAADDSLRRILPHVRADDLIIVASDHGNTIAGGHAGPEPDVLNVPLVIASRSVPVSVTLERQTDVAPFIAASLGLSWSGPQTPSIRSAAIPLAAALFACLAVIWTLSDIRAETAGRLSHTLLNVTIWVVLGIAAAGARDIAAGAALVALIALAPPSRWRDGRPVILGGAVGMALAALRLADGVGPTWSSNAARDVALFMSVVLAIGLGQAIGACLSRRPNWAGWCGAGTVVGALIAARVAGQTLSLSTLDVRWAYRLAGSEATLPVAALVTALLYAAPTLALVAGLLPSLSRQRAATVAQFAVGAGATLLGQLLAMSIAFSTVPAHRALAGGGLVRVAGEVVSAFMALAATSLLRRAPQQAMVLEDGDHDGRGANQDFVPRSIARRHSLR